MARGITKAGVATEMVDLLSVDTQELVEIIGRNAGVALLAPPSDVQEAQNAVATVLSAVKAKKQKVCSRPCTATFVTVDHSHLCCVNASAHSCPHLCWRHSPVGWISPSRLATERRIRYDPCARMST